MSQENLTVQDFIAYSRCDVLFQHQRLSNTTSDLDPDLAPLLKSFCETFEQIDIIENAKQLTSKKIQTLQKTCSHPQAYILPTFKSQHFVFQPHLIYIDQTTINVYLLTPAYHVSHYYIYMLSLWKFGLQKLNIHISNYITISFKDKIHKTDSFFNTNFETTRLAKLQKKIHLQYNHLKTHTSATKLSPPMLDRHCFKPSKCDYFDTCWKTKSPTIFDLVDCSFSKKLNLYERDVKTFTQLKKNESTLSKRQLIQINCELNNSIFVNTAALNQFFKALIFPIQCLDMEVITNVIPIIDEQKVFEKIPFLFSVHTLNSFETKASHLDFFSPINNQTLRLFAEALISNTDSKGSIIVFDSMLEKMTLDNLIHFFPDLSSDLTQIKSQIIDISVLFKTFKLYIPDMLGKFSLKAIHNSINKQTTHKSLDLKSGSEALKFIKIYQQSSATKQKKIEKKLRDYCKMDTKALVDIIVYLQRLSSSL